MKSLSTMFFFLFLAFLISPASSSSSSAISYSDHCASIIPELNPTLRFHGSYPLLQIATTNYNGGERILGKKPSSDELLFYTERSLSFGTTRNVYRTNHTDVYRVEAYLKLPTPYKANLSKSSTLGQYSYAPRAIRRNSLRFLMNGYWSESSGKLCMVGSGSWISRDGKLLNLEAVLKLNYAKINSTVYTSLVNGTLKSLSSSTDPTFFDPISIYALPEVVNYNYTLVTEKFNEDLPRGVDDPRSESLGLQPGSICPSLSTFSTFELEYATGCKPSKNCTPFDGSIEYLPRFMSLYAIQCSADEQKLRYVMEFPNSSYVSDYYYHPSDLNTTLVGEGSWDTAKKRLNIVACRILNFGSPQEHAHVGNCSIRLTLRFPATLTIRNSTRIVGQLWTNKTVQDSGFFDMIMVRSTENNMRWSQSPQPGLKYEYTELENVKKLCMMNTPVKRKADRYPSAHSQDMKFDMSVKNSGREFGWGDAIPISVGAELYENNAMVISIDSEDVEAISEDQESTNEKGSMNISYSLSVTPSDIKLANELSFLNSSSGRRVEITAEGIYDAETGQLCMVGCRKLSSSTHNLTRKSFDCEILVNFDFPPVNSRNRGSIKGSIRSTRKETDPLYFKVLNMTSMSFYMEEAKEFVWRMDLEIIMVLISSTLACIFVALQLFHMKKQPEMLPSVSLVMLVILTLGHMIPLVINFEALFLENKKRRSTRFMRGGWLEVNEVIVRLITLVAFLLVSRLLQLAWTARSGNDKGSWIAERKVLFISSPVYIAGGLIAILIHWTKSSYENGLLYDGKHSLLGDLRSYAGLVVDGFLLPQILLNIFLNSRENVLSRAFYNGTTLVRLLPHAYDLYRIHKYAQPYLEVSYMYANPSADLYSTAWDIIISCGGLLLALIIYLQQKFGSRCILPRRFREFDLYNKVPTTSDE